MKYKIEINGDLSEDILVYAKKDSPILERIEALLAEAGGGVFGYREDLVQRLDGDGVWCFFVEDGRVYAKADDGRWLVKERLYRLEELFSDRFVKINQSCLVNISKIARFEVSFGGALRVILKNGYKDYVSRRQLKVVKERLGF